MLHFLVCAVISQNLIYHKIEEAAKDYGVSEAALTYVVTHEAKKTPTGDFLPCGDGDQHLTDPNGNPHQSRGIVQINKYYHPEVSDEEAYEINFALYFLATGIRDGRGNEWTTYREYMRKLNLNKTLALNG